MSEVRVIQINESVFAENGREAELIRSRLTAQGTLFLNFMSSPGSGKTTTLVALINRLKGSLNSFTAISTAAISHKSMGRYPAKKLKVSDPRSSSYDVRVTSPSDRYPARPVTIPATTPIRVDRTLTDRMTATRKRLAFITSF